MRRACLLALPLLLFVLSWPLHGQDLEPTTKAEDRVATEMDRLEGTWRLVSRVHDGQKSDPEELQGITLVFWKDQYTYLDQSDERDQGSYALDLSKRPRRMLTRRVDTTEETPPAVRIYEWVDRNTLRFCSAAAGEPVPHRFTAGGGSGHELTTWKREQSRDARAVERANREELKKLSGGWELVSLTRGANEVPASELRGITITIQGDRYEYRDGEGARDRGKLEIDASETPQRLSTLPDDAADDEQPVVRIYEWVDVDTVRVATPGEGEPVPTDFAAEPETAREISVWKRLPRAG